MSDRSGSNNRSAELKINMDFEIESSKSQELSTCDIIKKARTSFDLGLTSKTSFREKQLKNLYRMYQKEEANIQHALKMDLGKSKFESTIFEIEILKNDVINVLANFKRWLKPESRYKRMMDIFGTPQIYHDPFGVVYIIGAWNYPFQSCLLPLASAIAAGNCVIIQCSTLARYSQKFLKNTLNQYLDGSCYLISSESILKLENPKIDYLFYTGTSKEARNLQSMCAQSLTPGTYVVGSQNPVYIDESADIFMTAQRVMWGKCVNAGQTCIAPGYVLCTQEVMKRFIKEIPSVISAFYGDPKVSPDYGRIISEEHFDKLVSLLNREAIAYGGHHDKSGLYFEPTILANVTPNFSGIYEEIYGPILPIIVMKNLEEVIAFLRAREKPLAFYIFARDNHVIENLLNRTSSGGVTVNDVFMHFAAPCLPFGGVGKSGFGSYHGKHTFDAFLHQKSVLKKPQNYIADRIEKIRNPPYTERNHFLLKELTRKRGYISTQFLKYILALLSGMVLCSILYWI